MIWSLDELFQWSLPVLNDNKENNFIIHVNKHFLTMSKIFQKMLDSTVDRSLRVYG